MVTSTVTTATKRQAPWTTSVSRRTAKARRRAAPSDAEDPFRLGFRERLTTTSDGREVFEQIPLTAEDLVYPEEGDVVTQGVPHFSFLNLWIAPMVNLLEKRPGTIVTSDVNLVLRHETKNCGPDIAVIEGDFDSTEVKRAIPEGGINLSKVGGRLVFALEAVSTSEKEIENKDLKVNVKRYAAEGVQEYFTVYPKAEGKVYNLVGRRLGPAGKYIKITPDPQGRVLSEKLGLLFSIDDETDDLVVMDAETGQRLRVLKEVEAAEQQEAAARQQAEADLKQETAARKKEAAARQQAEADLEQEAAARKKAEADLEQEAAARQQAEEARLEALAQVERLMAQLRESQAGQQ